MTESGDTTERRRSILRDRGVLRLLAANLIVIALALYEKWDANILVWICWVQSVIIGIFWFVRIVSHRHLYRLETRGLDGRPRPLTAMERLPMGLFFLVHYGGFHLGYLLLVAGGFFARDQEPYFPRLEVAVAGGLFFVGQLMSFINDPKRIQSRMAELSVLMGHPYGRILPMHVTILIGAQWYERGYGSEWVLALFLVVKTLADIVGYVGLERGFSSPKLQAELAAVPRMEKSPQGDKLILSDGQVVDLLEHPALARDIEGIFKVPMAVRDEVVRGLLAKESQEQAREELECLCDQVDSITGPEAHSYADRHLRLVYNLDDGSKLLACPLTGKRWLLVDDTLKIKQQ
jgi:hypothetical protein